MGITVTVRDQSSTGRATGAAELEDIPSAITLRDVIATRDGRASKLFLPFDDDPVLSLILSKAFLLADDTAIDDETILAQMNA